MTVHAINEGEQRALERTLREFEGIWRGRHHLLMSVDDALGCGGKLYVEPRRPKQTLSDKVCVGDEFRARTNAWLLDFFGYRTPVIPRGAAIRIAAGAILNPDDFDALARLNPE